VLLLHREQGRTVAHADLRSVPDWAKPIFAAAGDVWGGGA